MWIILPIVNGEDYLRALLPDLLHQTLPTRLLIIDQASDRDCSNYLQSLQDDAARILVWRVDPKMSLGATWNVALEFVAGQDEGGAWILNHDIRVRPEMGEYLQQVQEKYDVYFVSGVGVTRDQFDTFAALSRDAIDDVIWHVPDEDLGAMGGPDFSCFYFTIEGWRKYPFAEIFYPAYMEDVDLHRRLMLGGDGQRIFGVNFPFYHVASATIKHSTAARKSLDARYRGVLEAYTKKWGGKPNQETYARPYRKASGDEVDVTTPALFDRERERWGGGSE